MEEMEERMGRYRRDGPVCIVGDLNVHIGDRPSTLIEVELDADMLECGIVDGDEPYRIVLPRSSVDRPTEALQ